MKIANLYHAVLFDIRSLMMSHCRLKHVAIRNMILCCAFSWLSVFNWLPTMQGTNYINLKFKKNLHIFLRLTVMHNFRKQT